jgi:hypothetical protein
MDARKLIRDALIAIVVLAVAIAFFGSRRSGPVERAESELNAQTSPDAQTMPVTHAETRLVLSDGEPVVRLDGHVMGRDWFEQEFASTKQQLLDAGMDDSQASTQAVTLVLANGLSSLIIEQAFEEFDIQPDPDHLAALEERFRSNFQSEEEIQHLLQQMGMTMDRVRAMWEEDSKMRALRSIVAGMHEIEPDSPEAGQALSDWIGDRTLSAQWEFLDPDLEALFRDLKEKVLAEVDEEQSDSAETPTEPTGNEGSDST